MRARRKLLRRTRPSRALAQGGAENQSKDLMALPKDVKFVTFDCYGTLIDWESGVYDAFQKEADRDGFTIDRDALIPRFVDVQRDIQRGSYELYAEVLRRTAVRVAAELGWDLEPSRSNFLPDSVPSWQAFRETNAQLERFSKKFEIGILSNIDDKLLGATRRHFRSDLDLVVTAQQVRSYKPDPAHFKECARRIEGKRKNWVHIASGYPTDVDPCLKSKIPVIWVNRHGEELEAGLKKPDAEVKTFRDAGKLLKAA
jgi:2-haloacid dehalogenase